MAEINPPDFSLFALAFTAPIAKKVDLDILGCNSASFLPEARLLCMGLFNHYIRIQIASRVD